MIDLIVICGPTASGKTNFAIEYALKNNGEIVNADSMQIYKYMNIGTAKPTKLEQAKVKHHLIDIVEPDEKFSVAKYCEMAHNIIQDITSRGKLPIMVGGTGLYIDSVVNNITFAEIPTDEKYREELNNLAKINGNEYIYNMLQIIDKESAYKIYLQDTRRIIRALEIYHTTGLTMTQHNKNSRKNPSPYNTKMYAINIEREKLYERINKRVDKMIEIGLIDEVKSLLEMNFPKDSTAYQAIGYKEIISYLNGEISKDVAVNMVKQSSRRYAKRQLTWFKANKNINWI